jgi:hypothetical protein
MLVKEFIEHDHRIYTLELQEISKLWSILSTLNKERTPVYSLQSKLKQMENKVNPSEVSVARDAETGEPLVVAHSTD